MTIICHRIQRQCKVAPWYVLQCRFSFLSCHQRDNNEHVPNEYVVQGRSVLAGLFRSGSCGAEIARSEDPSTFLCGLSNLQNRLAAAVKQFLLGLPCSALRFASAPILSFIASACPSNIPIFPSLEFVHPSSQSIRIFLPRRICIASVSCLRPYSFILSGDLRSKNGDAAGVRWRTAAGAGAGDRALRTVPLRHQRRLRCRCHSRHSPAR